MDGKIVLVTGANRGIGKIVALQLVRLGARVFVAGRSQEKLEAACREIQSSGHGQALPLCMDLASQASIRAAVALLTKSADRLDVLVNNAATIPRKRERTAEGVEMQFAVNHLGPFLLTNLLLPRLQAAQEARVVNVSSNAHFRGRLDGDMRTGRAEGENAPYRKQRRYRNTKLANVLFTYALARRLRDTPVCVNAVRPGTINTTLVSDFLRPFGFLRWLFLLNTTSRGAAPIVRLASDSALQGVSGRYFDRFRERRSSRVSYDQAVQEALWETSARLSGLTTHRAPL